MNLIYAICLVVASVLTFFMGLQYGKDKQEIDQLTICETLNNAALTVTTAPITSTVDDKDCIQAESASSSGSLCPNFQDRVVNGLHMAAATTPEDVFGFLHHPSSPAKWNYYLTKEPKNLFKKVLDSPCQEIYLTRTGARSNQPNKCVAITVVPDGYTAHNQQNHRVG